MGRVPFYVTFAPDMDYTIRTSLPREVHIALRSHKTFFYIGGLVVNVVSSTLLTPTALFQVALITFICPDQGGMVPTPKERPRMVSNVIADVTPQGHAPWLRRLLLQTADDPADGLRPLPWLTPSIIRKGGTIS